MTNRNNTSKKRIFKHLGLTFTATVLAGSGIYWFLQESKAVKERFTNGEKFYQAADCANASRWLNSVHKSPLRFLDDLTKKSEHIVTECNNFLKINPDRDNWILYNQFVSERPHSPLGKRAKENVKAVFATYGAENLASDQVCPQIESSIANEIVPQPEANSPLLHSGCVGLYEQSGNGQAVLNHALTFLAGFAGHSHTGKIEKSVINNSRVCESLETFQQHERIAQTNLLPIGYRMCAKAYRERLDFDRSSQYLNSFIANYPQHRLRQEIDREYAETQAEVYQVSTAMHQAHEKLQSRAIGRIGGNFIIPFFGAIEAITGEDCITGKKLENWERVVSFIPFIGDMGDAGKVLKQGSTLVSIYQGFKSFDGLVSVAKLVQNGQKLTDFLRTSEATDLALLKKYSPEISPLIARARQPLDLTKHQAEAISILNNDVNISSITSDASR